jgi:hypothetical protein
MALGLVRIIVNRNIVYIDLLKDQRINFCHCKANQVLKAGGCLKREILKIVEGDKLDSGE